MEREGEREKEVVPQLERADTIASPVRVTTRWMFYNIIHLDYTHPVLARIFLVRY